MISYLARPDILRQSLTANAVKKGGEDMVYSLNVTVPSAEMADFEPYIHACTG